MQYMGSKGKISKHIVPIIQKYIDDSNCKVYIEPFVGGSNVIDKIKCDKKIGYDINSNLIDLLKYSQSNELPITISEKEYNSVKNNKENYDSWYVGLVGFCGSFGAKFFGGFARRSNGDDVPAQAIRSLTKQSKLKLFKDIKFITKNFLDLPKDKIKNSVIYCDIPYFNTTTYKHSNFPYEEFYNWCEYISKENIVLISEYYMPEDRFGSIWEMELKTTLGSGVNDTTSKEKIRVEKLFIVKKRAKR